jgi:hypothetical protein
MKVEIVSDPDCPNVPETSNSNDFSRGVTAET